MQQYQNIRRMQDEMQIRRIQERRIQEGKYKKNKIQQISGKLEIQKL